MIMNRSKAQPRKLHGANLHRTVSGVKLRRGLGGRWYFKLGEHAYYARPANPLQYRQNGWYVARTPSHTVIGNRVSTLAKAVALASEDAGLS